MRTIHNHIRKRLLTGVEKPSHLPSIDELQETEWSHEFERFMRNRLIMGALRYGKLAAPGKPKYDRVDYIKRKVDDYDASGNLECLVDVACLALCEFIEGQHPLRHFKAIGEHNAHCKKR